MVIYHQNNVAAFAGNHVYYWIGNPLLTARIAAALAAAGAIPGIVMAPYEPA